MQKRQANRAVIAQRVIPATRDPRISIRETSETARAVRTADIREVRKVDRARKSPRMTATQKDSQGKRSAWNAPAFMGYRTTVTTHQQRWSQTVTDQG